MPPKKRLRSWQDLALVASIHWKALRAEPSAYLMALWWRLRRKKLRSNYQFSSLFGRMPNAYSLWLIRAAAGATEAKGNIADPPIVVLIDVKQGQDELDETLQSLTDQGVIALQVGSLELPNLDQAAKLIDWEKQPWLMPIVAGDRLLPGAVSAYRAAIAEVDAAIRVIYADDDLIDTKGCRYAPHFKPDWNEELYRHHDYLTGASVFRAMQEDLHACVDAVDWMRDLTARIGEGARPVHLREILHHRRKRLQPRIPAVPQIMERELPPVTIVVPTRNRVDLLRTCIDGIAVTNYPDIEVIVVDNDSDDRDTLAYIGSISSDRIRVLRHGGTFNFSAINNRAALCAKGRLLCLLNNDIEIIAPDWLKIMAVQAQRDDVGAVGAQLLYPDGRIQHAGVTIGMGNAAGHAHRLLYPNDEGYFYRHALPHFITAVTAACIVVERERFLSVGGLDEKNFPVAFNDVDLCMRLNQRGWQSFYEPRARLIHHESVSRGLDRDPVGAARFSQELAALQRLWNTDQVIDPFHHPQLSRASEQFVVKL